ncbi:MAG: 6-phosphogluconolactonase [Parachlamydiaceae bacterium]
MEQQWIQKVRSFDDRRDIIVPGNQEETLTFCAAQFVSLATVSIDRKGMFDVALSGGSTPKALYQLLMSPQYCKQVDWKQIRFFWSDERSVSPDDPESNYHMAMEAALSCLPIPKDNIHRMHAESADLEKAAKAYETLIEQTVPNAAFDLVMLGMGDDGHTASLFPKTHGLHAKGRLVIANFIPQKATWRMTFTFDLINKAHQTNIYVIGKSKASMLNQVLTGPFTPDDLPIQQIGTRTHKALWIADNDAAQDLI